MYCSGLFCMIHTITMCLRGSLSLRSNDLAVRFSFHFADTLFRKKLSDKMCVHDIVNNKLFCRDVVTK